mmetsp:Transcript_38250/g.62923  ORF Transcript_38250/g.62923 Transcript_38250/m.62923 type:complete len:298 (+) Transcript_38250:111-1004(+)
MEIIWMIILSVELKKKMVRDRLHRSFFLITMSSEPQAALSKFLVFLYFFFYKLSLLLDRRAIVVTEAVVKVSIDIPKSIFNLWAKQESILSVCLLLLLTILIDGTIASQHPVVSIMAPACAFSSLALPVPTFAEVGVGKGVPQIVVLVQPVHELVQEPELGCTSGGSLQCVTVVEARVADRIHHNPFMISGKVRPVGSVHPMAAHNPIRNHVIDSLIVSHVSVEVWAVAVASMVTSEDSFTDQGLGHVIPHLAQGVHSLITKNGHKCVQGILATQGATQQDVHQHMRGSRYITDPVQ